MEYTSEQQRRALEDLSKLPGDSPIPLFLDDYGELRARCRAVEKK